MTDWTMTYLKIRKHDEWVSIRFSFLNSKGRRRCIVIHSKKESKGVQSSKENKESGDALHILTKRWCTSRCSVSYVCATKKRWCSVCLKCATRKGCTTWRSTRGGSCFVLQTSRSSFSTSLLSSLLPLYGCCLQGKGVTSSSIFLTLSSAPDNTSGNN